MIVIFFYRGFVLDMDNNDQVWLSSSMSGNDSFSSSNLTETMKPIYVFTPAGVTAKRVLCLILATIGGMAFLGNCFIFYFLLQKPTRNPIQRSSFVRNLNLYLRSLSLSDILSCAVSLPLLCIQISFDVFQSGWACKIVRYANFLFPVITINNLFAISLEKYLSTRKVLRTFSFSKMRKIVISAWLLGLTVMLFPAAVYDGIRVDLNDTHYTIVCKYQENFYPFKISRIIFVLQYVLPSVFVTYINICLMKTVWTRGKRQIGNNVSNAFKAHLRAKAIKGTALLVALTFAFIVPYSFYIANIVYTQTAKPKRDFSTDYIIRYASGSIGGYFSGLINFIIYFAQMKEFRDFLKKRLCRRNNENKQPDGETGVRRAYALPTARQHVARMEDNVIELRQFKLSAPPS